MDCNYCTRENCTHCPHCAKEFTSGDILKRHIQTVHGDADKYKCDECGFTSSRKDNLSFHILTVHEQNPEQFHCTHCDYVTSTKQNLSRHIQSVHNKARFQCSHCEFVCTRKDSLKRHMKIKHGSQSSHKQVQRNTEPQAKKIKLGDMWGEDLSEADIEMLAELEKGNMEENKSETQDIWNEELTERDIQSIDDMFDQLDRNVEPEKEKGTVERGRTRERVEERQGRREREREGELGRGAQRGKGLKRKREEEVEEEVVDENAPPSVKSAFQGKMKEKTWFVRGHKDPLAVLNNHKERLKRELARALQKIGPQKFYVVLKVRFFKRDKDGVKVEDSAFFHGAMQTLLRMEQYEEAFDNTVKKIWASFDNFLKNGSGWILERVEKVLLNTYHYQPIGITSYIETPKLIAGKHAVINVQNRDDKRCFEYSVNAALHHDKIDKHNAQRPSQYTQYMGQLKGCHAPMKIDDIPKFEKLNNIPIAVYRMELNDDNIYPLYMTKDKSKDPINLLLIEGEEHFHFAWIKDYNALLRPLGSSHAKVYCPYCCYGFCKERNGEENLAKHKKHCQVNGPQRIEFMEEGENFIRFNEFEKMQKLGFCIYADFECINKKVDDSERVDEEHVNSKGSSTTYKTNHAVSGYTFYSCSDYFPSNVQTYRGPDAGEVFLRNIQEEKERLLELLEDIKDMELTPIQEMYFKKARSCYICHETFSEDNPKGWKVRDHCHFTGNL